MAVIRASVNIPRDTGLAEDVSVNTLCFDCPANGSAAEQAFMLTRIQDFYTAVGTGMTQSVASYMASVNSGQVTVKFYRMSDPSPRVPIGTLPFAIAAFASTSLPEEVATCLSFRGTATSGVPAARRRGRIFIGPLGDNTKTIIEGRVRPLDTFRTNLGQSSRHLYGNPGTSGIVWGVWSSTGQTFTPITSAGVDNAFDTQRRRGPAASSSSLVEFP